MNEWLQPLEGDATPVALAKLAAAWLLVHGLKILLVLILAWLALRAAATVARRIIARADDGRPEVVTEKERRAHTLAQILTYTAKIFVWVVAGLMILREVGTDITPFLTGAGIAGIALGFGAQSLVKDTLAGIFILSENQFRVGDVVELAGKSGVVEEINLRTTVLRSLDGAIHVVPNGQITVATNMSFKWSRAVVDVEVAYDTDLDALEALLERTAATMKTDPKWAGDLLEEPQVTLPERFNESSIMVRTLVKTQPLRQWDVARELRRRIKRALDEAKIEIPYPHRVVEYRGAVPTQK